MGKRFTARASLAALVFALALASLATAGGGEASASRVVKLGRGTTLTLARGVHVTVVRVPRTAALPSGERRAGGAVSLRFRGGTSFLGRLRLRLPPYSRSLDAADLSRLYRVRVWQGAPRGWRTFRSRLSSDERHLIAELWRQGSDRRGRASRLPVNYISGGPAIYLNAEQISQVVDWIVEDLIKLRSPEHPDCLNRGAPPAWAQVTGLGTGPLDPMLGCLRGEGDVAVAELVNNRPFGVVLRYGQPVEFGWADGGFGLPKLYGMVQQLGAPDGLYIPPQESAAIGVKPFEGSKEFRSGPTRLSIVLDFIVTLADVGSDEVLEATSETRCKGALVKLLYEDPSEGVGDLVKTAATEAVDCLPAVSAVILRNIGDTNSTRALRWKFIRTVTDKVSLATLVVPLATKWGAMLVDKASGGALASFSVHGSSQRRATQQPVEPDPTPTPPPSTPAPKPYAGNLRVVVYGGGHVGVAFDVGWQAGRDPVTCHFFRDGHEVFTAQCGTYSSKQFYGVPAGTHSWHATVSDRFGVYSNPTNTVVRYSS